MNGRLAGVIGWPIAQSLSPAIHRYWLREHGIKGDYVALPVRPEHFERCVAALPFMGFAGVNVTVPHKRTAAALASEQDEDARATGAVNMLTFGPDMFAGSNSDVRGFLASLEENLPVPDLARDAAAVLGAGGAARSIVVALGRAGFREIRLLNRTRQRALQIRHDAPGGVICKVLDWGDWRSGFAGASLLVNTTTLGMVGKPSAEVPLDALARDAAVADIVYNPVETALLRNAKAGGRRTMDGLGMLMYQAVPAFAAWFGVRPTVTSELRSHLIKALAGG